MNTWQLGIPSFHFSILPFAFLEITIPNKHNDDKWIPSGYCEHFFFHDSKTTRILFIYLLKQFTYHRNMLTFFTYILFLLCKYLDSRKDNNQQLFVEAAAYFVLIVRWDVFGIFGYVFNTLKLSSFSSLFCSSVWLN